MSASVPSTPPETHYKDGAEPLHVRGGYIWAPLRGAWLLAKPEELVRQRFIHRLHTQYGYALGQMAQERRTQHGRQSPKADIIVARDEEALRTNRDYVLVVETKAENVTIRAEDYAQGESYARAVGCEFMMAHNEKETRAFRLVTGAPGSRIDIEDVPGLADLADSRKLEAIRRATKAFSRDEFRKLLFECHTILRDNHKLDPGGAFDEISKVLFIKMYFERSEDLRFTVEYLDKYADLRRGREDQVMEDLFEDTKDALEGERLFDEGEKLNISYATFRRLVSQLERFNLSSTSDDIKGIAFEQFLGQTFRGELGQFFTPRPVVDFMVGLTDPNEGELVCDPACGTGGFLIRAFDHVREAIEASVQAEKDAAAADLEKLAENESWAPEDLSDRIEERWHEINQALNQADDSSRLGRLAGGTFFGADAEARAARTSKMNMVMHGDGHGGIYFHDGLLDTGGMLRGRFDVVLTNPPFGASVANDQLVGDTPQTRMAANDKERRAFSREFGDAWKASSAELAVAERERWPILQLFDIGRDPTAGPIGTSKVRNARPTETLFLERAISLLKPGGRVGIVLPEGVLNNSSMEWLRRYVESRAKLLAVVSVPHDVFASSKATVKTSLVFLQRFTDDEKVAWDEAVEQGEKDAQVWFADEAARADSELVAQLKSLGEENATDLRDLISNLRNFEVEKRAHRAARIRSVNRLGADERQTLKRLEGRYTRLVARSADTGDVEAEIRALGPSAEAAVTALFELRRLDDAEHQALAKREDLELQLGESRDPVLALIDGHDAEVGRLARRRLAMAEERARELFDYPVFMAEVEHAGITATGATGPDIPNELPEVLTKFHEFVAANSINLHKTLDG